MASLEKTFLKSLQNLHGGSLTTRRSHLRQALRLDKWNVRQINNMISQLNRRKVIKAEGTDTHITLTLRETA